MSNVQTVVADAVAATFVLSAGDAEQIAIGAEMVADSALDFRKGCDLVGAVLGSLHQAGSLTFAAWEVVRKKFESAAESRARDNGAIDPAGAANDYWGRVTKFIKEYHGLTKPKSENPESKAKAEKREQAKAKMVESAGGRSAEDLKAEVMALYAEASDESVAKAKALEKVVKVVQTAEKDAVAAQIKPLVNGANDAHKAILEFLKLKNDQKLYGDYVVLLNRTLDAWKQLQK